MSEYAAKVEVLVALQDHTWYSEYAMVPYTPNYDNMDDITKEAEDQVLVALGKTGVEGVVAVTVLHTDLET